jgi:hypothetical protein
MARPQPKRKRRKPSKVHRDLETIDWSQFERGPLSAAKRARAGASWRSRMGQEFLAVGAFATLIHEVAEEGCDPVVLQILTRASSDEVRHAEICRKMAEGIMDVEIPTRWKGVPSIPKHTTAPPSTRVLLHMVEMCCLSETFTGVFLTEMLSRMPEGSPRMAVESLLEDEIDHGRVGWAYLASRAQAKELTGLGAALPKMLERTVGGVMAFASANPEADDVAMEALGYLSTSVSASIYRRTLRDVILPGLEQCGIEVSALRRWVTERAWV